MRTKPVLSLLVLTLLCTGNSYGQEGSYRLGVQDRLRIHVHEWPVLTGEFTIGPDGKVTLPMIGDVAAAGLMSAELAGRISEGLKAKAQLLELPDAAVSVSQYRPFYILGGVERPGEYAFRPNMVVLNAVSIAGGVYRPPRSSDWGFERDSITGGGDIRTVLLRRDELSARQWRLQGEAAGLDALPAPEGATAASRFLGEERAIFLARNERQKNQTTSFDNSVNLLEREIISIQEQAKAAEKQKESVARELEDTRALISRGLAPAPRILPLERTIAQIDRELRELDTSILRARQQINLMNAQKVALRDERQSTARAELQSLLAQSKELDERFETATRLIAGSAALSSAPTNSAEMDSTPLLTFVIMRPVGDAIQEIQAMETTRVQPGDIVKVFRPQEAPRPLSQSPMRNGANSKSTPAKEQIGALR
jgi:protein involved in polysaccharide export with SLBB domain